MSEENQAEDGDLSDDDPLLRAVARAPHAHAVLETADLPASLRKAFAARSQPMLALPEPGAIIDQRYRIDERLGAGGMGVVFAATHLQTQKPVALKWMHQGLLLRSDSEQSSARRRFEREARIAARVRHPNLVDVQDASSDAQRSYLVMERLEGETLGARMKRGPLAWDELLSLLLPTLRGVAALHREGVIHRDLKPENIFLAQGVDGLCPKVLDFGVAALREGEPVPSEDTLTRPGSVLGTPGYMPLEQLRGERALSARTDVYALGVLAYEALSGRRPFRAGNAAEHAALLASEVPTPLSVLVPALRGPRADAVMRAIARDARDRHASSEAFADALRSALPTTSRRARTLVLGITAAALIAGLTWWASARPEARTVASTRPLPPLAAPSATPLAPEPRPVADPVAPSAAEAVHDGAGTRVESRSEPSPMSAEAAAAPAQPERRRSSPRLRARADGQPVAPASESAKPPTPTQVDRATSLTQDDF